MYSISLSEGGGFLPLCNHHHFVPFHFQFSKNWEFYHCICENELEFILCLNPAFCHAFLYSI